MDAFLDKVNIFFGIAAALMAMALGKFWWLFLAFLILNAVDFVTGIMKAKYTNTETSAKGAKGIIKKVGYWVIIGISFFVSVACIELGMMIHVNLGFMTLFGYFTLATYIINEIRSILENLVVVGVNPPPFLVKGLAVAKKLIDEKANGLTEDKKINNHGADGEKKRLDKSE